jgi:Ca2+-transporting ATPase
METMAAMTLVCTDKTGTLTANRIVLTGALAAVDALEPAEGRETQDPEGLTRIAKIASERPAPDDPRIDPIDVAVWQSGDWEPPAPIARFGFDSSRRLSSALAEVDGRLTLCVKGAVEAVLVRCTGWRDGALTQPLDSDRGTAAMAAAHTLASGGARVLAVASREMAGPPTGGPSALERDLVLEGFLAFSDPLRPEVPAAIDELFRAGVAVTMVTGDGPATAESVARQAGLGGPVFIGAQIRSWAQDEIAARTAEGCVVARARPEDKLHIVQAATAAGEVVAVTGDGVNDAPALLAAALGVAIGRGGSEAARESADMVLADDNFATLARAAAEARRLSSNLRQAVRYYLVVKLALIAASLALIAAGHAALFTPLQIVVVGLFAVASASIIFISGPPSGARWPRDPKAPLLDVSMLVPSLIGSLALAIVGAAGFLIAQHWLGERAASTIALAFWLVCQGLLGLALAWDPGPEPARALTRQPAMLAWAVLGAGAAAGILLLPPLAAFLAR